MTRWSLFLQTLSLLHHFLGLYSAPPPARRAGRYARCVTPKLLSVSSKSSTWMCVTGEPCETESLMHGSAGGRRKSAPHGVTRRRPTLHHDAGGIGPTVELVISNAHAPVPVNGNGNGHHDEAEEPQQSLFSWAAGVVESQEVV